MLGECLWVSSGNSTGRGLDKEAVPSLAATPGWCLSCGWLGCEPPSGLTISPKAGWPQLFEYLCVWL